VRREVAAKIASKTADEWRPIFEGKDCCCCIVSSVEEALRDPHFAARGVFDARLAAAGGEIPALPVPVHDAFRVQGAALSYPALGEANSLLGRKA
jgi:crotonobetainyl-CoA:carnitine CoA-transferase CaiB-like acyl-CoA transferase